METLKKPNDLWQPDPRNLAFITPDSTVAEGVRPVTIQDEYEVMAALELPPEVPERIQSAFAVARNLWLYAWYHWPFYVIVGSQAYRCMEAALLHRFVMEHPGTANGRGKQPGLAYLLKYAIERKWLSDGRSGGRGLATRSRGDAEGRWLGQPSFY